MDGCYDFFCGSLGGHASVANGSHCIVSHMETEGMPGSTPLVNKLIAAHSFS